MNAQLFPSISDSICDINQHHVVSIPVTTEYFHDSLSESVSIDLEVSESISIIELEV